MHRLVVPTLALLALAFACPALAEDDEPLIDRFYMTVGAGQSLHDFDEPAGIHYDDAPGANLRLGFEAFPILDTELEYEFAGRFDDDTADRRVNVHTLTGNLKLRPLAGVAPDSVILPYALVGFGWIRADVSSAAEDETDDGWAARVAMGIEIPVDSFISVFTEGSYVFGGADANDYQYAHIGAGLTIRFQSSSY